MTNIRCCVRIDVRQSQQERALAEHDNFLDRVFTSSHFGSSHFQPNLVALVCHADLSHFRAPVCLFSFLHVYCWFVLLWHALSYFCGVFPVFSTSLGRGLEATVTCLQSLTRIPCAVTAEEVARHRKGYSG